MSLSANDIIAKIMENAMETSGLNEKPGSALKRFQVNQTYDQLPDFRVRNAFYRAELERQIADKKEAERRRKEREALEEDRFLRKIESDREKLRREYLDEIEKRRLLQDEALRKQQAYAKKLEEIHEEEERKKEEEVERRRQQAIIDKRIADLKEKRRLEQLEEIERRRLLHLEQFYGSTGIRYPALAALEDGTLSLPLLHHSRPSRMTLAAAAAAKAALTRGGGGGGRLYSPETEWDYYKRPWNSRDYVHSAIHPDNLILEDVYFEAPLPILADVYKKLDSEKKRIKDIMRQRIIQDTPANQTERIESWS